MDDRVAKLKSPRDCEIFGENALRLGRKDLADEARQQAVRLRASAYGATSEAERECLQAVYAYEETLSAKNGKRTRASRTWQMIERHGIIGAVERAVNRPDETVAFSALREAGLSEFAFEVVILRHAKLFSADTVRRARERMSKLA